jgi:hypothetical protein
MGYLNNHGITSVNRKWSPKYLGLINHVVFVVDASASMRPLRAAVLNLLREQIKLLAKRSEETGQETRVSVYLFDQDVECVVYDRDVLRSMSLDDVYEAHGMTALMDATSMGITELQKTATLHGDHSFLFFVITDGDENQSRFTNSSFLNRQITSLPENWTMTCFVPDLSGTVQANRYGFPQSNIVRWDTTVEGMERLSATLTQATDTYFTGRTSGVRGYKRGGLFGGGEDMLNDQTVQDAGLVEIDPSRYSVFTLSERIEAKPFCEQKGFDYKNGVVYYEWFNTQDIQPQKTVLFQRIRDGKVFTATMGSQAARDLLGLDARNVSRGKPAPNKEYRRFIQSTAPNRKLIPGKHALVLDALRSVVSV